MALDPGTVAAASAGTAQIAGMFGASKANKSAREMADKAMKHEADQFAHRYQTTVGDLEKAGLNKMLATGTNPSSPGGMTAPVQNEMEGLASTALDVSRLKKEMKAVDSQADLNTQAALAAKAQADAASSTAAQNRALTKQIEMQSGAVAAEAALRKQEAEVGSSGYGQTIKRANEIGGVIRNIMPGVIINPGGRKSKSPKGPPAIPPGTGGLRIYPK